MNKEIYIKNMEVLKEKYIEIYNRLKDYEPEADKIFIDESVNGEKILAVKQNEHLYYLNSRYSKADFMNNWLKNYEEIKYREVFLMYGLSDFSCAKELIKKIQGKNIIMLYEPDIDIFYNAIHIADISETILEENVLLCIKGVNDACFQEFLLFVVDYDIMKLLNYICMPNYATVYGNEWKEVIEAIKNRYEGLIAVRNTCIKYAKEFIGNQLDNARDMLKNYSLNQIRDKFRKIENISEIPVIIVAAGPSLNKNVNDLKMAEGKAYIIAVDTALKTLLNNSIRPDLVVTIDGHKPPILFAHKDFFDIPVVACGISNSKIWHIHSGKRLYFHGGGCSYMSGLYKKVKGEDMQLLESGGSVANDTFSMTHVLGFRNIILIGQDLAYPNNREHVSDAYMGMEKDIKQTDKKYFEVQDIYGGKVYTETNMNIYRIWFENQLDRYPYLKVTDATEGGAKIKGTKISTLREVIERECKYDVDKEIISGMECMFNETERKELNKELDELDIRLDEAKKKIDDGIRKYEKLSELSRKNKETSKEFKNVMSEIDELIEEIEKDSAVSLSSLYSKSDEYEVMGVVNDIKDDVKEEIKEAVKNGIKLLNGYKKGINLLKEDLEDRKTFKKEKYNELMSEVEKNIKEMECAVDKNEDFVINSLMKKFMVLSLDLVDMLYKAKLKNYDCSVEAMKEIIIKYTDKNYEEMLRKMKSDFIKEVSAIL